MLDEQQKADYAQIREQVSAKNKRKEFYEDRFSEIDVSHETVTIEKVIDQNTFLTKEYGNNPIRFAGVRVKQDDETSMAIINQMLKPGTKVKIALDNDPQTRVRDDIYDTMRAVVYAPESQEGAGLGLQSSYLMRGQNMNLWLSKQENVTVNDDNTDISTLALFDDVEIGIGRLGNFIRRDIIGNTPILNMIADIYLPTDDAVSSYEKEIFSKSWRSWDEPVKGWLQPMFENTARQNPLEAALHGGGIGALASIGNRAKGFWVGAAVFGTIAGVRTVRDTLKDDDNYDIWKPKRREKEFEINEYFDRITYLKYKGLYSRAVELAYEEEGVDLERIFQIQEDQDKGGLEEYLKEKKKWLTIEKKTIEDYKSGRIDKALEEVKQDLESLGNEELLAEVGPYTALALRYKDAYESTLFAAGTGETYDYNKIYRALPYKDRPFFTEFIKAKPRDRQRILELVPDNQRPIYQRFFGMDIEEVQTNEEYFSEYALPHQEWEGWEAGESLDNVKIKVMRNEGVELTESNYWPEDEAIADEYGLDAIEVEQTKLADRINPGRLEKILRGAGLQDVSISFISTESETSNITANLNITNDRTRELDSGLREYLQYNI